MSSSSRDNSISELAREIAELRRMQEQMLGKLVSLLEEIKDITASSPFVDPHLVHFLVRENATLNLRDIAKGGR
jgi:hypothetical protein